MAKTQSSLENMRSLVNSATKYMKGARKRDKDYKNRFETIRLRLRTAWDVMGFVKDATLWNDPEKLEAQKKRVADALLMIEMCEQEFDKLVKDVQEDIKAAKAMVEDAKSKQE